jgi:hypothetical protein
MLSARNAAEHSVPDTVHDAAEREESRGWAPLAVPPLTLLLLGAASSASSPRDMAIATLSLLALALAAVAFAAAGGDQGAGR